MANVSLKTDFKDGDKLFAQQLNNNFSAIKAALEAMNKVAWQDNLDESVIYFKGTTEDVAAREIIDGQVLYDYELGTGYIDSGDDRIEIVSGSVLDVVVNSLAGDQTNKAPSVHAVNAKIGQLENNITTLNSRIRYGTTDPASSLGSNGDIYLKYNE